MQLVPLLAVGVLVDDNLLLLGRTLSTSTAVAEATRVDIPLVSLLVTSSPLLFLDLGNFLDLGPTARLGSGSGDSSARSHSGVVGLASDRGFAVRGGDHGPVSRTGAGSGDLLPVVVGGDTELGRREGSTPLVNLDGNVLVVDDPGGSVSTANLGPGSGNLGTRSPGVRLDPVDIEIKLLPSTHRQ